jgi:hypothetical protein
MNKAERIGWIAFPIVVLVGAFVAWAGSQGGVALGGWPVFALAVGLAYLVQWIVFVPSFLAQTEKYFDLTGGLTYISITLLVLFLSPGALTDPRSAAAGRAGRRLGRPIGDISLPAYSQSR